jgi:hypothetical protein
MSKGNGQADVSLEEQLKDTPLKDEQDQTLEKELPLADPADGFEEKSAAGSDPQAAAAPAVQKDRCAPLAAFPTRRQ